jgi:superfamily II DNA or RNA helicase
MEQYAYDRDEEGRKATENIAKLNPEQRNAVNAIVDSVRQRKGQFFFLNGPAGTGKTFVYNVISSLL